MSRSRKLRFLPVLLIALMAMPLYGRGIKMPHRGAREQILALEDQWKQAQIAGDIAAMEKLLAENYIGITISGQVVTKAQQLERMGNRELIISRFQMSDTKIKVIANGRVAIVNSLAAVEGTAEGRPLNGSFRYTRVYQRLPNGTWKITSFEATRVPRGTESAGAAAGARSNP